MGGESSSTTVEITPALLVRNPPPILPRVTKSRDAQSERTKKRAEVFTPSSLCAKMNGFLEGEILAAENAKDAKGEGKSSRAERVDGRAACPHAAAADWHCYVDTRILEITCGEAPFIVSRYDAATGEMIPVEKRIGILDRKLRLVNENAADEKEWMKWAIRAYESVYGYELQGDSLAIARANLLITFAENMEVRWGRKATTRELTTIANRIVWNFWQMDGLTGKVGVMRKVEAQQLPGFEAYAPKSPPEQLDFFAAPEMQRKPESFLQKKECRIFDWRKRVPVIYNEIGKGKTTMKFDFAIGNPPYQEETVDTSDKPIYNIFMDGAYDVADKVELITPARFLFNAGKTPKAWNEKMLADPHLKVLEYTQRSGEVFSSTDIKGGVAVTYRDATKECGAITTFSTFPELNSILHKVITANGFESLEPMFVLQNKWNLDELYKAHPECRKKIGSGGKERRLTTSIFTLDVFHDEKAKDDVKILGLATGNKRIYKYVKSCYLAPHQNLHKYKVIVPKSNGSGAIGEVLSTPLCGTPLCGYTQSFIGIGAFDKKSEAENCLKYVKTKFARTMLGVLKVTQDNPPNTWRYVPLQDFTSKSDIDWSKSVKEIDQQLYRKYKLSKAEIKFIETHVKEME